MKKTELSEGVARYTFEPLPGMHFNNNIFALVEGGRVLLIDTAYEFQALQVLKDIKDNGLEIDSIIISHFHDDHMQGMKVLPGVPVYGSGHYKATLDMWTKKEEHGYFTPTTEVNDTCTMRFGRHSIALMPFPGHSLCTILTLIDDKYVHVADELMFSNEGAPILPSADPGCINRHVESLERLRAFNSYIFLPGHGPELSGPEKINRELDSRLAYFNAILSSSGQLTYSEASRDRGCKFLHSEWHKYVYE